MTICSTTTIPPGRQVSLHFVKCATCSVVAEISPKPTASIADQLLDALWRKWPHAGGWNCPACCVKLREIAGKAERA